MGLEEGFGGLAEERPRRCPVSRGVDTERGRERSPRRSGLRPPWRAS